MQDVRLSGQQIVASGFTRRTKTTKIWDQINAINVWQSFTVCTIYFQDVGGCQSCRHKKSARVLRLWQKRSYEHFVQKTRLSTNSSNPLVILAIFPASFCDGKKTRKNQIVETRLDHILTCLTLVNTRLSRHCSSGDIIYAECNKDHMMLCCRFSLPMFQTANIAKFVVSTMGRLMCETTLGIFGWIDHVTIIMHQAFMWWQVWLQKCHFLSLARSAKHPGGGCWKGWKRAWMQFPTSVTELALLTQFFFIQWNNKIGLCSFILTSFHGVVHRLLTCSCPSHPSCNCADYHFEKAT